MENAVAPLSPGSRVLTAAEFHRLRDVPPESVWFASIDNENTRTAYKQDVSEFIAFIGIQSSAELRFVTQAHVLAWKRILWPMEKEARKYSAASVRRKLSAVSSLFGFLCEKNAVTHNPAKGVSGPKERSEKGRTPAISDADAKKLLNAPPMETLKGKRDRAILSPLLFHALRRAELCSLRVMDIFEDRGFKYFRVQGKGDKERAIAVHPVTDALISEYLIAAGHKEDRKGAFFRPVRNRNKDGTLERPLSPGAIFSQIVLPYGKKVGIAKEGFGPHSLRATSATNA